MLGDYPLGLLGCQPDVVLTLAAANNLGTSTLEWGLGV